MFAYRSHIPTALARDFARRVLVDTEILREGISTLAVTLVTVGALIWGYRIGASSLMIGAFGTFMVVGAVATLLHVARHWFAWSRSHEPRQIRIGEFGLSIATPQVEVIRPWHAIRSVGEYKEYLLLKTRDRTFNCLPTKEMPLGAREYVIEHVWASWRPPNNALEQTRDG